MIQNILVLSTVFLAVWILYRKFFKKNKNTCGSDQCGCN